MNTMCRCFSIVIAVLLAGMMPSFVHAGVISYTSGSGGSFDPSSPSTFTFDGYTGTLAPGVDYTKARIRMYFEGASPSSDITISGLALTSPGTDQPFGDITFTSGDESGTGSLKSTAYVDLTSPVNTANLADVKLSFTIPSLVVADGWKLWVAAQFQDADADNFNTVSYQFATASNPQAVPEPGSVFLVGSLIAGVGGARLRRWRLQRKG